MGDQRTGKLVEGNIVGGDLIIPLQARLTIRRDEGRAAIMPFENEFAAEEFVSLHIRGTYELGKYREMWFLHSDRPRGPFSAYRKKTPDRAQRPDPPNGQEKCTAHLQFPPTSVCPTVLNQTS